MRRSSASLPLSLALAFVVTLTGTGCRKKKPLADAGAITSSTSTTDVPTAEPTATTTSTAKTGTTGLWVTFEPEPTKFTSLFPGTPTRSTTPTPSAAGLMTQLEAQVSHRDTFYALGWMDFPAGAVIDNKKALDGARDGATKSAGGRIVSEKQVKLNGKHPGREIVFDVVSPLKARGYLHVYIVNKRFYQALVLQPDAKSGDKPNVDKFLEGFKVK